MSDPDALRVFGKQVDFGRTASDYSTHRAGFPPEFFSALTDRGYLTPGQSAIDLGTGTGTIARGLAQAGLHVTALDIAPDLLSAAAALDTDAGVQVAYKEAPSEATGLPNHSADLITAGQCWHWFDRPRAASEAHRLLRPGGRILIAHFDWLPLPGSLVAATEALILRYNPDWAGADGTGLYPEWLTDLAEARFQDIETASFDVTQSYSHDAWRGRIRASAGVAASLAPQAVTEFDAELAAMMECFFKADPAAVPHRVWWVTACKPEDPPHK
ncbi:MAG: methyltransferase domain-containing protein [Pseudomonadota bacterium]